MLEILLIVSTLFFLSWLFERYRWYRILSLVSFGLYSAGMSYYLFSKLREDGGSMARCLIVSVISFAALYFVSWNLHKLAMYIMSRIREYLRDRKEQRKKNNSDDMGSVSFWFLLFLGLAAIVGLCYLIMH